MMVQSYPSKPSEIPNYFKIKKISFFFEPSETIGMSSSGFLTWRGGRKKDGWNPKPAMIDSQVSWSRDSLVGGWINQPVSKNYAIRQIGSSPNIRGEIKKYLSCHVPSCFFGGWWRRQRVFYEPHLWLVLMVGRNRICADRRFRFLWNLWPAFVTTMIAHFPTAHFPKSKRNLFAKIPPATFLTLKTPSNGTTEKKNGSLLFNRAHILHLLDRFRMQ